MYMYCIFHHVYGLYCYACTVNYVLCVLYIILYCNVCGIYNICICVAYVVFFYMWCILYLYICSIYYIVMCMVYTALQ